MPQVHYFAGNQLLAVGKRVHTREDAPGICFFCPICSEIWFRAIVYGQPSLVSYKACMRHRPGEIFGTWVGGSIKETDVPGSVWWHMEAGWREDWPPEVWAWELGMELQALLTRETDQELVRSAAIVLGSIIA